MESEVGISGGLRAIQCSCEVFDYPTQVTCRLRVEGQSRTDQAVLVNCHYDAVYGGPGAGDDGVACSVMLEMIRTMLHSKDSLQLKYPIIFLFNNAEEVWRIFQVHPAWCCVGSRAFMHAHPWAKDVRVVINLEGSGTSGSAFLFRVNNYHLLEEYNKVAFRPYGNSLVMDSFRKWTLPTDTDYGAAWVCLEFYLKLI